MQLGFIGTGALTSAIVTGLKSAADNSVSILLSPRNEAVAAGLAGRYRDVRVATDNQSVLDNSDTIILAVRPQVAREVIPQLRFRRDHHVVSLIVTLAREEVTELTAPAERVTKVLPIPTIAQRQGAILLYPSDPGVATLFGRLGKVIDVENASEFDALSVVTASFASYFRYLETMHTWLKDHGVADPKARDYVASLFKALGDAAETSPEVGFMELAEEYATAGGINEQVLRDLTTLNLFEVFAKSLDGVHRRIAAS